MDSVLRRVELLKLEGLGFSQGEIVKELSRKAECSERTIYNDFETRTQWQPTVQCVVNPDDVLLKVINRYEQIYRQASRRMLTSDNEWIQISAL
jgi:transcriptional antiterminator